MSFISDIRARDTTIEMMSEGLLNILEELSYCDVGDN